MKQLPTLDQMRHYVLNEILKTPDVELADNQELLLSGLLDSISVTRLVAYIEETSGISVPPEDLLPENFGSLIRIQQYLQSEAG